MPTYVTDKDVQNMNEIAEAVAYQLQYTIDKTYHRMHHASHILVRDPELGTQKYVVKAMHRSYLDTARFLHEPTGDKPVGFEYSKAKIAKLLDTAAEEDAHAALLIRFSTSGVYSLDLTSRDAKDEDVSGRTDRDDPNDIEPLKYFPMASLRKVL
jgi:hypothetical protein